MNPRQQRTLQALLERPARADIRWADIESLLKALGAEVTEGRGSRVWVALAGQRAVFHRPHPQRVAGKGLATAVRDFLTNAEIAP